MGRRLVFQLLLSVLCFYGVNGVRDKRLERALGSDVFSIRSLKSAATAYYDENVFLSGKAQILGGEAMSPPCCVSPAPGRVDCFIRSPKATVQQITKTGGEYGEWVDIGGEVVGPVECFSRRRDLIEVAGKAADNSLVIASYDGTKWSDWQSIPATIMEAPSCVVGVDNRVDCNTRDIENKLTNFESSAEGTWNPPTQTAFEFSSPITCMQRQDRQYNCWGSSPVNQFRSIWKETGKPIGGGGPSKPPERFPVKVISKPSACGWNNGARSDIFSLGIQNQLMRVYVLEYGGWQPFEDLGGKFESTPSCVSNNVDTIQCIGVGRDSKLYRKSFEGGKWSEWIPGWGGFLDGTYCLRTGDEEVTCYVRDYEKALVEVVYALK